MNARSPLLPQEKKRIGDAVVLWQLLTLLGVVVVSIFAIWHLKRRGAIVRSRIAPPVIRSGVDQPPASPPSPGQAES